MAIDDSKNSDVSTQVNNQSNTKVNNPNNIDGNEAQQTIMSKSKKSSKIYLLIIIVILAAAFVFIYIFLPSSFNINSIKTTYISSTNISTTNVINTQSQDISSCTTINQPGVYNIVGNITTEIKSGSCINIVTNNVEINGNHNHLIGSGPYIDVTPFTYGIMLSDVSNVTINNLSITRFSYLLYLMNSHNNNLIDLELSNSTVSGMFFNNSSSNKILNSTIYGSQSLSGGVNIKSGNKNSFIGTSFINNAYYGLYINSTDNVFNRDIFSENPTDLICGSNANIRDTNNFSNTNCQSNQFCNFATCTSNDYYSIKNVKLSKNINTCGVINNYGTYTIFQNLNLSQYVVGSAQYPCLTINSPNVRLNCNNKTIYNSYYGIYIDNLYNTTLENCKLENDTYGVFVNSAINTNLNYINSTEGKYGIYIVNSTSGTINNSIANNNEIGVYENQSSGFEIQNVITTGNIYGEYLNDGQANNYNNIKTINNLGGDIYCSVNTYNSLSVATVTNASCISTDCQFASNECTKILSPPLAVIPIVNCQNISIPGSYMLTNNISSYNTCITISTSNVTLKCNNKLIIGGNNGYGIIDNGNNDVSISNCNIENYNYGIYASNLKNINIENVTISGVNTGSVYKNVTSGYEGEVKISQFKYSGISLINSNNLYINKNTANGGLFNATGFIMKNVNDSNVSDNIGNNNQVYGFSFVNSTNNIVLGNRALDNNIQDYYCGSNENINSNKVNINTGIKKSGCPWLVVVNPAVSNECFNFENSGFVNFESDEVFIYGDTCYVINDLNGKITNNSDINCFGHTIYATNGGIFANVNTTGVTISNCYLIGFTYPIIDKATHFSLNNVTIIGAKEAINVSNSNYLKENNVTIIN
ncbi:MAG: hypothetical protein QXD23_01210 [Candidatus Micrarchaeaceae archaeon]